MSKEWENCAALLGRTHPNYPDDLQVVVHQGGPRFSSLPPEYIWVKIIGYDQGIFKGTIRNKPHNLTDYKLGSEILFHIPSNKSCKPVMLTQEVVHESKQWTVVPCTKGYNEILFDPPSKFVEKIFPNLGADNGPEAFTYFCGICGGVMVVRAKGSGSDP